jgi:hypothetical protein
MSITTFTELKTAMGNWAHRDVDADRFAEMIALCEADLQVRAKLVDFEASAAVAIVAGSGDLPAGFAGMRSIYWDGNTETPLEYVAPARFDGLRNSTGGTPNFYMISGSKLYVNEGVTGSAVMTYSAKFTALSGANASNAILVSYPDAYLYGSLYQLFLWEEDDTKAKKYLALFDAAIARITKQNKARKYAGRLAVRPG